MSGIAGCVVTTPAPWVADVVGAMGESIAHRGRVGRAHVERRHGARAIVKRLIADYEAILREQRPQRGTAHAAMDS